MSDSGRITPVIPADAGIQCLEDERRCVPASAGTTGLHVEQRWVSASAGTTLPAWLTRSLLLVALAFYTAFSAGPFVWLASMSLRTTSEISANHYALPS